MLDFRGQLFAAATDGADPNKRTPLSRSKWGFRSPCLTCKSLLAYYLTMGDIYHALAAPARRTILDELHERDGQTLYELCTRLIMKRGLDMSRQAISQHLDVLEEAGLIRTERDGRYKFHYLDASPLREIQDRWLD